MKKRILVLIAVFALAFLMPMTVLATDIVSYSPGIDLEVEGDGEGGAGDGDTAGGSGQGTGGGQGGSGTNESGQRTSPQTGVTTGIGVYLLGLAAVGGVITFSKKKD
ncbi:MAG: LPXTG cell wall anchor domain-containing protein [Lachnospiraceae bacterium]|nr:LPXTG cell wall anchor domain-containing protein [Lachnospiraceae bacterium]